MTREEAEHKIAEKLKEIKQIAEEYGTTDKYLSLCIHDEIISFNNRYWELDNHEILDYIENIDSGCHQHFEREVEE